ncbi:DeoR/GlpR family transcriptional regulator [Myceligenerans sp. I2]|uniref:DeoR/GlpR family transcriptional regulator n=2 Tax=Myceligenerans indicum TaxID=2593663 RepID=A0ABS1LRN8_9MICO|nr:DeoR/GlpR family transcriptional regulator [Myceligenerans indicum]
MHLPRARHEYLLREIELRGSVHSADVASRFGVSEVTIRRDIIALETAGKLARVHGGAIALASSRGPQAARAPVGVIVPSTSMHFPEFVRGMEALAPALRVRLVLGVSHYRPDVETAQVERMVALGVGGIVIAPTTRGCTPEELARRLRSIPVPVVLAERRIDHPSSISELDLARTDLAHGAVIAVEHLHGLGHRRIGLGVYDRTPTAPHVREGYARAATRLGLEPGPVMALSKGEDDPDRLSRELGELLDRCAQSGTRAVLVHTDDHAARLVESLLDRGLKVPGDLAVVAYDDENADLAAVPLTTITPPRRELGREALRLLVDRITEGDEDRRPPRHVELLPRLTVRDSCGGRRPAAPAAGPVRTGP